MSSIDVFIYVCVSVFVDMLVYVHVYIYKLDNWHHMKKCQLLSDSKIMNEFKCLLYFSITLCISITNNFYKQGTKVSVSKYLL